MRTGRVIVMASLMLALVATTARLFAEVPNKSPEQLGKLATHIVTGEVAHIYCRGERKGLVRYERYLAEVRVKSVEQQNDGESNGRIEAGSLIYVRYFTKRNPPGAADTAGHRSLPAEGDSMRIYLARNAADGYHSTEDNSDGGFNVAFPNGFEPLKD